MGVAGKAAGLGAVAAAVIAVPRMIGEVREAKQDEALTQEERSQAKGGAIGDAVGSVAGAAAGALAGAKLGAAVGSIVPGIGTAIGGVLGAGIGALGGHFGMQHGGRSGRVLGEMIGGVVGRGRQTESLYSPYLQEEVRSVGSIPQAATPFVVDGEIVLRSELVIDDRNYYLRQSVVRNDTPYPFAAGSATDARLIQ